MRIRKATSEDLEAILHILPGAVQQMRAAGNFQCGNDYPNAEVFARDLALDQLWIAEEGEKLLGAAAITQDQSPEYADAGWDLQQAAVVVHRLVVDPDARGMGVATALMQQAETVASERGIALLRCDTNSNNEPMQKLFLKLGYTFTGEIGLASRPGLHFYCYGKSVAAS